MTQPPDGTAQPDSTAPDNAMPLGHGPVPYPPPPASFSPQPQPYAPPPPPYAPYSGAPPQQYSYAPYTPSMNKTNTLAIVALVLAFLVPVAGVVCAHLARKQIRETGQDGEGVAMAAMIVGYAYLALVALACCAAGVFAITTGTST